MFLAVPILVGFMTLGGEFIAVWMGPGYTASAWVLLILATAHFGRLGQSPGQHDAVRPGARAALRSHDCRAVAGRPGALRGLGASDRLGIYGIAIGTACP